MDSRILTYTGTWFDVFNPRPEDVDILDIAHALACTNRFGGHTDLPYTVAQHSVLASQYVPEEDALWALLHDASETYLGDMPKPIKDRIPQFGEVEEGVLAAVAERFGLETPKPESVKAVDRRLMLTEARDLMPGPLGLYRPWAPGAEPFEWTVYAVDWTKAKRQFLSRYEVLTRTAEERAAAARRARGNGPEVLV